MAESAHIQSFAVVETSTPMERIRQEMAMEGTLLKCILVPRAASAGTPTLIDICTDGRDTVATVRNVRSTLFALSDAADRGLIEDFRVIKGSNLLRTSAGRPSRGQARPGA